MISKHSRISYSRLCMLDFTQLGNMLNRNCWQIESSRKIHTCRANLYVITIDLVLYASLLHCHHSRLAPVHVVAREAMEKQAQWSSRLSFRFRVRAT